MEEQRNVTLDWRRLWAGGLATAGVAALIAWLGTLICRAVLDVEVADSAAALDLTDTFEGNYALTAAAFALVATALAHVLSLTTPTPRAFFSWIVGLLTAAAVVLPFTRGDDLAAQVCAAVINLLIGAAIGSLLAAVLSRTAFDRERSWQR
jgi:hypothetical protein